MLNLRSCHCENTMFNRDDIVFINIPKIDVIDV